MVRVRACKLHQVPHGSLGFLSSYNYLADTMTSPKQFLITKGCGSKGTHRAPIQNLRFWKCFIFSAHFTKDSLISPVSLKAGNTFGHEETFPMSLSVTTYYQLFACWELKETGLGQLIKW